MINISEIVKTWPKDKFGWSIAPANVHWIPESFRIKVGKNCTIKDGCVFGNECVIDSNCRFGNYCSAGRGCIFGNGFIAGDFCSFDDDCFFRENCTVHDRCSFGHSCTFRRNCIIHEHCKFGEDCRFGQFCTVDPFTQLGNNSQFGDFSTGHRDLGVTDGYRKGLAFVNSVPYIGVGCRWFTFEEALEHWGDKHPLDRRATMAQLRFAQELIGLKG